MPSSPPRPKRRAALALLAAACLGAVLLLALALRQTRSAPDSAPPSAPTGERPAADAARSGAARRVVHRGAAYDVRVVDVARSELRFYWRDGRGRPFGSIGALGAHLERAGRTLLFATNAGMYRPDQTPVGLYVEDGRQLVPLDTRRGLPGNFYLPDNGVFFLTGSGAGIVESSAYPPPGVGAVRYATQSGPLLVRGGRINALFEPGSRNLRIRSGVGIVSPDSVVFAISEEPVSFHAFATLFRDVLGCRDALFLDGEISLMYVPELARRDTGGTFGAIIALTD
jgi:uncharacterized protein YigE (DUF2233 family)